MATSKHDGLIIAGGGLAGSLLALAVAARRPDVPLLLIEAGDSFGGNHLWSFFDTDVAPEDPLELVRTIATARILMPASMVRLSAGRLSLTDEAQALCFVAGANSVFLGDRLLTTPNPGATHDERLFDRLGMQLTAASATLTAR